MARPPRGAHPEAHPTRISQELAIVPKVRSLCNDGERRGTNIIHPQKKTDIHSVHSWRFAGFCRAWSCQCTHLVPSCQTVSSCFANPAVLPQKSVRSTGCSINAARLIKWIRCISFTRVLRFGEAKVQPQRNKMWRQQMRLPSVAAYHSWNVENVFKESSMMPPEDE